MNALGSRVSASGAPAGAALQLVLETLAGQRLPGWDRLSGHLSIVRLRRGEVLYDVGTHAPDMFVVRRGTLTVVVPDAAGREWIVNFCQPGDLVVSLSSFAPVGLRRITTLVQTPKMPALDDLGHSQSKAVALTNTELDRIDGRTLSQLCERHVEWSNALLTGLFAHALTKEKRERELLTMTPEERYRQFVNDYPHLLDDLTQKDIARHLGITPVGLSRIASRVRASRAPDVG